MRQANIFLSDFLSFDPDAGETLWRAMRPTGALACEDGAVSLEIPFRVFPGDAAEAVPAARMLTLVVRAYGSGVLRLSLGQSGPGMDDLLAWDASLEANPLRVEKSDTVWWIQDGASRVLMQIPMASEPVTPWSTLIPPPDEVFEATFHPDGAAGIPLAGHDTFTPARQHTGSLGLAFVAFGEEILRWTWSLAAHHNEHFAGTGERFSRMNLAGGTYFLENTDALGVNSRRAYKNVPFYLSSRGYGLLALTPCHVRFSLGDISQRAACGVVEDAGLDLFLFGGTPERILFDHRRITGFPAEPPVWSFGTWMAKMTYFSAEETEDVGRRMRAEGFPCDVLHLDTGWFQTDWKCEWEFSKERFPDPAAFFARMREMGFRVSLWQLPAIARGTKHWDEATSRRFVAPKRDNSSSGSNFGTGADDGSTIDFTNPEAVAWYQGLLAHLLALGAAAIKTDFGEIIDLSADYHGMSAERLHNVFPLLYQRAAFDVTRRITGDAIIWARAGWTGCQRYPIHWGGDAAATWDGLSGSLRGGLHLGLSGFGYWSHDVPGFHGVPDFMNSRPSDELYVRWTQFGVFSSHLRYHGTSAREPYEYPAIADVVRRWLHLRYALIPYFVDMAGVVSASGFPILRALLLHHPDDPQCWQIDDQFYCGDALLVAPVLRPGGRRDVYLPEGEWIDFWTGEKLAGARWLRAVESPLERIPVYGRAGHVIRVCPDPVQQTDEIDWSRVQSLTLDAQWRGESLFGF